MNVKLKQAVKMFFGNSSLEMVYFEAIANALDAEATKIKINITADSFLKSGTLKIRIEDNGLGLTDIRYKKFCNLFDIDENSHKGIGRLVYLSYFNKIEVTSVYENVNKRAFIFDEEFTGDKITPKKVDSIGNGTVFYMTGCSLEKIHKKEYVDKKYLYNKILEIFYAQLYTLKQRGSKIEIEINSFYDNEQSSITLSTDDMPELTKVEIKESINLLSKFYLHYFIEETPMEASSIITAISIDNRTQKIEIISKDNLSIGYKMVFLLYSDLFTGKVDIARQNLTFTSTEMQNIKRLFKNKVAEIINKKIPRIPKQNKKTQEALVNTFPHLNGYFNNEDIGYNSYNDILQDAQDKFFIAQRDILGATDLTDEQFEKSIELSSRALTEYVLFRQIIIDKLKDIEPDDIESKIHNLIVPQYEKFEGEDLSKDLYRNCAWVLDDKFMTYDTILSEKEMTEVISVITKGEVIERESGIPDIALIFSNNPNEDKKVDVVIVEIKRKGIKLEDNMKTVTQLEVRARKLMKYYNNKIQRIWFYGIVEFNDDLEDHLAGEYTELYSSGKMYYRETSIAIKQDKGRIKLPAGIFMMDLDSIVSDADARNSTFLNLIKSKFIPND